MSHGAAGPGGDHPNLENIPPLTFDKFSVWFGIVVCNIIFWRQFLVDYVMNLEDINDHSLLTSFFLVVFSIDSNNIFWRQFLVDYVMSHGATGQGGSQPNLEDITDHSLLSSFFIFAF